MLKYLQCSYFANVYVNYVFRNIYLLYMRSEMMSVVLNRDEVLLKVFNNNIILVSSEENEKILFAKGIGFGKKPGACDSKGDKN